MGRSEEVDSDNIRLAMRQVSQDRVGVPYLDLLISIGAMDAALVSVVVRSWMNGDGTVFLEEVHA